MAAFGDGAVGGIIFVGAVRVCAWEEEWGIPTANKEAAAGEGYVKIGGALRVV